MTDKDPTDKSKHKKVKKNKRKNDSTSNDTETKQVKRAKFKKENSEETPNHLSQISTNDNEKKENENADHSRKAEKRKERRQKKKEKKALLIKQNHIHEGKGQNKALRYLDAWQSLHDGKENSWKFEKCRQIWLLQNAYEDTKIPDSKFDSLLKYIATIQGKMRETTIETAKKKIERAEKAKQEDMAVLENNDTDKNDTVTEKTSKKSKKKSKKKIEVPKDDILTDKALQRAAEIVEMLTD